jgi:hypothetical protein
LVGTSLRADQVIVAREKCGTIAAEPKPAVWTPLVRRTAVRFTLRGWAESCVALCSLVILAA